MILPNFLVIGAAKCGTTSIYRYLSQHPQVYLNKKIKEAKFFSLEGKSKNFFNGPRADQHVKSTTLEHYSRGDVKINIPDKLVRSKYLNQNFSEIPENEIVPVDKSVCVAKVDGQLYAFERRCPYQGADLSVGYIKEGKVYCPWHNYWIDPKTGSGPCSAIRAVKTYNAEEVLAHRDCSLSSINCFESRVR